MKVCDIGKENGVISTEYDARQLELAGEHNEVRLEEVMTWGEIEMREDLEPVAELIRKGGVLGVVDSELVRVYTNKESDYEIYVPEWWN